MRTLGVWWARVSGASAGEPTVSRHLPRRGSADCCGRAWASPCPHPAHQHECTLLIKYKGVQRNPGGEKLCGGRVVTGVT